LRTRVFQVNYLVGLRSGRSDIRSVRERCRRAPRGRVRRRRPGCTGSGLAGQTINPSAFPREPGDQRRQRVSTISQSDFWNDLVVTLKALVGTAPGRKVIVNPQAGIVIVQAMPGEIRDVEKVFRAMRLSSSDKS